MKMNGINIMARDLKGSDLTRNIKNIINRTLHLNQSKRSCDKQNMIHSIKTLENRQRLLNEFKNYLEQRDLINEKMNQYMNDEILKDFISIRVEDLTYRSAQTIISTMSGIITSLRETNVNIPASMDLFQKIKEKVKAEKYIYQSSKDIHKSFENVDRVLAHLYNKNHNMGLLGETLYRLGLRHNEGMKLLSNPKKYIQGNKLIGLKGKSGKVYQVKIIPKALLQKIKSLDHNNFYVNHKSFHNAIKQIEKDKNSHSFRYEYIKQRYKYLTVNKKLSHKKAMLILAKEVNHFRNTTPYYLNRI